MIQCIAQTEAQTPRTRRATQNEVNPTLALLTKTLRRPEISLRRLFDGVVVLLFLHPSA